MTNTKSYVIKDFYESYCNFIGNNTLYQVDYKTFRALLIDYFIHIKDEVLENGKDFKLPCRLGDLSIVKHKPKEWTGKSLRIDYKLSKEYGKIIYHLNEHSDGYKYRAHWSKKLSMLKNKTKYQLILTRYNKRRLAQIIKNNERDYPEL